MRTIWLLAALLTVTPFVRAQDPPLPPPAPDEDLPPDERPAPPDDPARAARAPERGAAQVTVSTGPAALERVNIDVEAAPLADVMEQLGRVARAAIAVDPGVNEAVTVSLRDIPWREAADVIARMCRCEVEELPGGGKLLTQPTTVSLSVVDADVRGVAATIGRLAGQPVIVLPDAAGRVTLDLREVPWRDALSLVASAVGAQVTTRPGLTILSRAAIAGPAHTPWRPTADGPRVNVSAANADLQDVMEQVGRLADRNVLVDPSVDVGVSLELADAPWQVAVYLAARRAGCQVEERQGGILLLTRPARHVVRAAGAAPGPLLQLIGAAAGLNIVVSEEVGGLVFADLPGVSFRDAVRLIAAIQGWQLEEREDALVVTAAGRREPPLPTTLDEAEVAKLVDDVARFARERRLAELDAAMAALRERVAAAEPKASAGGTTDAPEAGELELELEGLFRDIEMLAKERQVEELIVKFTEVRQVLARGGPAAGKVARRLFAKWGQRLADLGEVSLSLKLQLDIQTGNDALRSMADGIRLEDWERVRAAAAELDDLVERMRGEEREVFHRNAEALHLRAKALRERAERLETIDRRFASLLRVTAVLVPDDDMTPKAALVGGQVLREGDTIVDPRTGAEVQGLRVVEVNSGAVRFRYEDTEFVRELQAGP